MHVWLDISLWNKFNTLIQLPSKYVPIIIDTPYEYQKRETFLQHIPEKKNIINLFTELFHIIFSSLNCVILLHLGCCIYAGSHITLPFVRG